MNREMVRKFKKLNEEFSKLKKMRSQMQSELLQNLDAEGLKEYKSAELHMKIRASGDGWMVDAELLEKLYPEIYQQVLKPRKGSRSLYFK